MKKRIHFIWLLSLFSALLLIVVQGYWLYEQYRLAVDTTACRLAAQVLAAGEKEYALRKAGLPSDFSYTIHRTTDYRQVGGSEVLQSGVSLAFLKADTLAGNDKQMDFRFHFRLDLPEDSLYRQVNQAFLDGCVPFRAQLMDSLLRVSLPGIPFTLCPLPPGDTLRTLSGWRQTGSRFRPLLEVVYLYNPLRSRGAILTMPVPVPALLRQMGWQLSLSAGLILLLIGCLVFQMRTILEQKKLGELRQEFVHTLVHELKRPVQTLKMCLSFLADPVHLANVLNNLIENAVKYSGPEVRIEVAASCGDHELELRVTDNGYGIAADDQKRVFDLFYRSSRFSDPQIPGLGLGLSYVRQIAEAHGGRVVLHSRPGEGTAVTVYLPVDDSPAKNECL